MNEIISIQCKYCYEPQINEDNPIIFPCKCSDGVHIDCLAIWLTYKKNDNRKKRNECEICINEYIGIEIHITPPSSPQLSNTNNEEEEEEVATNNQQIIRRDNSIIDIDFICCECYPIEGLTYAFGIVLGIISLLIICINQYQYNYNSNVQMIFNVVSGASIFLFITSILLTTKRIFIKKITYIRRVHITA